MAMPDAMPDAMPHAMPDAMPRMTPLPASAETQDGNAAAAPDLQDGPHAPAQPSDIMLELITCLVAPLFMAGCCGDLSFARLAAVETIASYHARTQAELVKIGQIIAFGLAAMDNLRLSMTPDLSLSMTLRLRGGANALNRSAQRNTATLEKSRRHDAPAASTGTQRAMTTAPQSEPVPAFNEDITEADIQAAVEHAHAMVKQAHARLRGTQAAGSRPSAPPLPASQPTGIQPASPRPAPASHQGLNVPPAPASEAALPAAQAVPHQAPPGAVSDPASPAPSRPAFPPSSSAQRPAAIRRAHLAQQPDPSPPASTATGSQHQLMWASAMSAVASQVSGNLADAPAARRKAEQMWANALGSQASSIAIAAGSVPRSVPRTVPLDTDSGIARTDKPRKPT